MFHQFQFFFFLVTIEYVSFVDFLELSSLGFELGFNHFLVFTKIYSNPIPQLFSQGEARHV